MATVDCSPGPRGRSTRNALVEDGARVPIILRAVSIPFEISLIGLVDTGTEITIIDRSLIDNSQISPIDSEVIGVAGSIVRVDAYILEIEVPGLQILEFTRVLAANLPDPQTALLGRQELRHCKLVYDGPTGKAELIV